MLEPSCYAGNAFRKVYEGKISISKECIVTVNGQPLPFALQVERYTFQGLSWGFECPESTQLAIALLNDAFGPEIAKEHYWALEDLVCRKLVREVPWVCSEYNLYLEFLHLRETHAGMHAERALDAIYPFFKSTLF
jgi:hypothetical protein